MSKIYLIAALLIALTGCTTTQPNLPLSKSDFIDPDKILVWVGRGESFIWKDGAWLRSEANDYNFSVTQRRYSKHWDSIKDMHRRHPDYDGSAGPRDQTMHFMLSYSKAEKGLKSEIKSSLGTGTGSTDVEFRKALLEIAANGISSFAPYNKYRISQSYNYEEGQLIETVELFKQTENGEVPFVKINEKAKLFSPTLFQHAPTRFE